MQIDPKQVPEEIQVSDETELVKLLVTNYGVTNPKIILVFYENADKEDMEQFPWKVRVFYKSPKPLQKVDLFNNLTLLRDTKIQPVDDDDVIRTIYQTGYYGICTSSGGNRIWIT